MITKLIQIGLICGSLFGTILIYTLLLRMSEGAFTFPKLCVLVVVVGAYLYGAATFMAMKGIHFPSKTENLRRPGQRGPISL